MGYREIIEEDDFNRITEQNIKFLDEISQKMKQGYICWGWIVNRIGLCRLEKIIRTYK